MNHMAFSYRFGGGLGRGSGQREITRLGIYFFNARFYSPKLGRFLSADTIVPGYANPRSLKRFSYVTNDPLRYTDPTEHMRVADQDMQLDHVGMNCSEYPQYCNNGKTRQNLFLPNTRGIASLLYLEGTERRQS
jgi:RHS repeat-associated protein